MQSGSGDVIVLVEVTVLGDYHGGFVSYRVVMGSEGADDVPTYTAGVWVMVAVT